MVCFVTNLRGFNESIFDIWVLVYVACALTWSLFFLFFVNVEISRINWHRWTFSVSEIHFRKPTKTTASFYSPYLTMQCGSGIPKLREWMWMLGHFPLKCEQAKSNYVKLEGSCSSLWYIIFYFFARKPP